MYSSKRNLISVLLIAVPSELISAGGCGFTNSFLGKVSLVFSFCLLIVRNNCQSLSAFPLALVISSSEFIGVRLRPLSFDS
jgi:hypothetical protein